MKSVVITGVSHSGKSTLLRALFPFGTESETAELRTEAAIALGERLFSGDEIDSKSLDWAVWRTLELERFLALLGTSRLFTAHPDVIMGEQPWKEYTRDAHPNLHEQAIADRCSGIISLWPRAGWRDGRPPSVHKYISQAASYSERIHRFARRLGVPHCEIAPTASEALTAALAQQFINTTRGGGNAV